MTYSATYYLLLFYHITIQLIYIIRKILNEIIFFIQKKNWLVIILSFESSISHKDVLTA